MKHRLVLLLVLFSISFSISAQAQTWSGILDPSRAIDWTQAGVVGGIPSATWTQCGSTIAAGASAATINTAISNCTPGTLPANGKYVQLGAGTFNLTQSIHIAKSGVVLRGMGANQTHLVFGSGSGSSPCWNGTATMCISIDTTTATNDGSVSWPGQSQAASWTAGYAQGATSITLTNVGSNGIINGQYIYLNQANVTAPPSATGLNAAFFVCDTGGTAGSCSNEGGSFGQTISGVNYSQLQAVQVTAGCASKCTGAGPFTITITPGLYGINWASARHTYAWWPNPMVQYSGIENLSMDGTNAGMSDNGSLINLLNAANCWVSGVAGLYGSRNHIGLNQGAHLTVQNSYFYQTNNSQSLSYGVELELVSASLIVNNIMQQVVSPILGASYWGNVVAYNYSINHYQTQSSGSMYSNTLSHDTAPGYVLWEGNFDEGLEADDVHGSGGLDTLFRNFFTGYELGKSDFTIAVYLDPYARDQSVIGNVLGTPGKSLYYDDIVNPSQGASQQWMIYNLNQPHGVIGADAAVATTLMRWGNYDSVTGAVSWNSSEVPSTLTTYANAVPANHNLPASFVYTSTPSWWPAGKPWPPIGPDVTSGNIGQCVNGTYSGNMGLSAGQCTGGTFTANINGGHANSIPAMACYFSMGGPPDGSGNALSFNASACHVSSGGGTPPAPPTALAATVN